MKIDPNLQYLQNLQSDGIPGASKNTVQPSESGSTSEVSQTDPEDSVQISGQHMQVQKLTSQLAQMPDVRGARVAALRQQVQQGTYKPTSAQIANAAFPELFAL